MGLKFNSVPIGSLTSLSREQRLALWQIIVRLPPKPQRLLFDWSSGAYIRGLTKQYKLDVNQSVTIACLVTRVVTGQLKLAALPAALSTELPVPNDKAKTIAREIENDLLRPVLPDLEKFWTKDRQAQPAREAQRRADQSGVENVLNLKQKRKSPPPPWR